MQRNTLFIVLQILLIQVLLTTTNSQNVGVPLLDVLRFNLGILKTTRVVPILPTTTTAAPTTTKRTRRPTFWRPPTRTTTTKVTESPKYPLEPLIDLTKEIKGLKEAVIDLTQTLKDLSGPPSMKTTTSTIPDSTTPTTTTTTSTTRKSTTTTKKPTTKPPPKPGEDENECFQEHDNCFNE